MRGQLDRIKETFLQYIENRVQLVVHPHESTVYNAGHRITLMQLCHFQHMSFYLCRALHSTIWTYHPGSGHCLGCKEGNAVRLLPLQSPKHCNLGALFHSKDGEVAKSERVLYEIMYHTVFTVSKWSPLPIADCREESKSSKVICKVTST